MSRWFLLSFALIALESTPVNSFAVLPAHSTSARSPWILHAEAKEDTSEKPAATPQPKSSYDPEEEVQKRLARAKAVLAKSKAKLEGQQQAAAAEAPNGASTKAEASKTAAAPLPFFAAKKKTDKDPKRKEKLIKAKDDKTGLVTADGEVMAALSETEEWE